MKEEYGLEDTDVQERRLVKRLDYIYVMPILLLLSIIQVYIHIIFESIHCFKQIHLVF
jgi:hypothetical protein